MKFKNYHLRERHPEGFISTQPHKPRLEATETDSKSGIWIGSAGDNKFFKKEDYRFLYELFRELVENGIEPLTDDLMHKDELAKLRAERDALVERANEQYLEQVKETAALRVGIGLLTTLAPDVDCGLPITELCWAVHKAVTAEIAALRERLALVVEYAAPNDCYIRAMRQPDETKKWKVISRWGGVLNKRGEWEYEPLPSYRDDAYYERCRFDTAEEARQVLEGRALEEKR